MPLARVQLVSFYDTEIGKQYIIFTIMKNSNLNTIEGKKPLKPCVGTVKKPLDFSKRGTMKKPDLSKKYDKPYYLLIDGSKKS